MELTEPKLRCIGRGFCGSVWATDRSGSSRAMKREDGGPGRDISNDYDIHRRVLSSLDRLQQTSGSELFSRIHVPQDPRLVLAEDSNWWDMMLPRFPTGYQPCRVLVSERIPPLLKPVREFLIDTFCPSAPPSLRDLIKTNKSDEDCLVRAYLGRRCFAKANTTTTRRKQFFSLRNFPLHIDQMEDLGDLAVAEYAKTMAAALAMMHWDAQIDANDVEFVLASPRPGSPPESTFGDNSLGEHALWILDFDCCRKMSMDEEGIDQAVAAFYRNDPFYPRPGVNEAEEESNKLWEVFRSSFLDSSALILAEDSPLAHLPGLLMNKIEQMAMSREASRPKMKDDGCFGS